MQTRLAQRSIARLAMVLIVGTSAATAAAQSEPPNPAPRLTFESRRGTFAIYNGDLQQGTFVISHRFGQPFVVDRDQFVPMPTVGVFEQDVSGAQLWATLVAFFDNTPSGDGAGDVAQFEGAFPQGPDVGIAMDAGANSLFGNLAFLELTDETNHALMPKVRGVGVIDELIVTGDSIHNVPTICLEGSAILQFSIWLESGMSLQDYLATGGLGGELEVEDYVLFFDGTDCWGDFNGDYLIDQVDLGHLLGSYGVDDGGDLNGDGTTDQADLGILLSNYNTSCS